MDNFHYLVCLLVILTEMRLESTWHTEALNKCLSQNWPTDIEKKLMVTKGEGSRDKLGDWDWNILTSIYKTDNQQGPTVEHRELYSISCNNLSWKRIWQRIYIYTYTRNQITLLYTLKLTENCKSTKLQ